jgi:DNA-binding GntR family transcriptional regulator
MLREQVKGLLLGRILSGEYAPGERLVETRIAQELGTSQAPVREALRELESMRFIESEPFRGARVRAISLREILEVYPVRSALEEIAAREAVSRLEDIGPLEQELDAMRSAAAVGDVTAQVEHDAGFHRLIVAAAGNATLLAIWDSLGIPGRTAVTFLKGSLTGREVVESHVPILRALRDREPEAAARRIREHFQNFADLLQAETALSGRRVRPAEA